MPGGGINIMLPDLRWLASFDYSWIWAILGDVWAVNVKWRLAIFSSLVIYFIIEVLPVPVEPYRKTGSLA